MAIPYMKPAFGFKAQLPIKSKSNRYGVESLNCVCPVLAFAGSFLNYLDKASLRLLWSPGKRRRRKAPLHDDSANIKAEFTHCTSQVRATSQVRVRVRFSFFFLIFILFSYFRFHFDSCFHNAGTIMCRLLFDTLYTKRDIFRVNAIARVHSR